MDSGSDRVLLFLRVFVAVFGMILSLSAKDSCEEGGFPRSFPPAVPGPPLVPAEGSAAPPLPLPPINPGSFRLGVSLELYGTEG